MEEKCRHGLNLDFCAICEEDMQNETIPGQPIHQAFGEPVFILRSLNFTGKIKILRLAKDPPIAIVSSKEISPLEVPTMRRQDLFGKFAELVAVRGFLFLPRGPLTWREQGLDGPSHCYYDKRTLSKSMGTLGCTQCRYYVCSCGRCLCGYTGVNYMGQLFSQIPPLPLDRTDRVEYIRAFKYLNVQSLEEEIADTTQEL